MTQDSTAFDAGALVRPALAGFEPYDPAFTPCKINLSANENTHELPSAFAEKLAEAATNVPLNRYPDPMANELRDALAQRHGVTREMVCVGNGGDELLFNLLFTFGGEGRTLVTCPPDFAEYANFATMCDTQEVAVPRDAATFAVDTNGLVEAARDAALVFLTSPNNPTGNLIEPATVERLLTETKALVLVDEAYVEFAGKEASFMSWVADHPRLILLRTLSKAFGLAGLRLGYVVANPSVINQLAAVRQIYSVDVVAQAVALAAVQQRDALEPVVADIVAERARFSAALSELPGVQVWPSEANFVLVRMPDAARVRARLRDEFSILVRDFSSAPGLEGCLRITVGTHEENDCVVEALRALSKEW